MTSTADPSRRALRPAASRAHARRVRAILHPALRGVVAVTLVACTTWQPMPGPIGQPPPARLPYTLRVTRASGSRITLLAPFIRADTLFGRVQADTVGIPLREVRQLDRERFSVARTAGLALALPAAILVTYLIVCRDSRCEPTYVQ